MWRTGGGGGVSCGVYEGWGIGMGMLCAFRRGGGLFLAWSPHDLPCGMNSFVGCSELQACGTVESKEFTEPKIKKLSTHRTFSPARSTAFSPQTSAYSNP